MIVSSCGDGSGKAPTSSLDQILAANFELVCFRRILFWPPESLTPLLVLPAV